MSGQTVDRPQRGGAAPGQVDAQSAGAPGAVSPRADQAMAELLLQHFAKIWRMARRMGLGPAQAEEAAQEAFIVLFEKQTQVDPGKELAFLLSTVAHISRNLRRKSSQTRELPCDPDALDQHAGPALPLALLERKRARDQVDQILASLSEPLRVVFILYELEEQTLRQIADILAIPLGTAGSRLRLARKGFQKELRRLSSMTRFPWEEP